MSGRLQRYECSKLNRWICIIPHLSQTLMNLPNVKTKKIFFKIYTKFSNCATATVTYGSLNNALSAPCSLYSIRYCGECCISVVRRLFISQRLHCNPKDKKRED